jgi:hypothetical protein
MFLSPSGSHYTRSGYGERYFRPSADGWYPARSGRPAMPVLIDAAAPFPGTPLSPWPRAEAGKPFFPPTGCGVARLVSDERTGRCGACGRAWPRRLDGALVRHRSREGLCPGTGQQPSSDVALASWLPVLRRATPHGFRHGLQTWMDEDGIPEVLKTERLGHEMPGMHAVYGHVSDAMRAELRDALQARWDGSLRERGQLSPRSVVPVLDRLLAAQRESDSKIGSHSAPKIGHQAGYRRRELRAKSR